MEITGIDYYFETNYSLSEFYAYFKEELKNIWLNYYEDDCSNEGDNSLDYFYTRNKKMFDRMDDYGFYLNKKDEGPFLLMLGANGVTVILPGMIEDSAFCKKIYDIIACKLKVSAQKNY